MESVKLEKTFVIYLSFGRFLSLRDIVNITQFIVGHLEKLPHPISIQLNMKFGDLKSSPSKWHTASSRKTMQDVLRQKYQRIYKIQHSHGDLPVIG